MTAPPAVRKARACTAGVVLAAASGLSPAAHHPLFAVPGLVSAAIFAMVAASYRREAALLDTDQQPRSAA